jgi:glycerate kinase
MPDIIIAPNSFKECADSSEAADLFAKYLPSAFIRAAKAGISDPNLIIKPLSDGGDGFLNAIKRICQIEILEYAISAPFAADSKYLCKIGYCEERREVYIESAEVLGMKRIPREIRKPLELNSKGMGELLKLLAKDKAEHKLNFGKVIIGIGGTGTVDFGIGMCGALGMKLFDERHKELEPVPKNFTLIKHIIFEKPCLPFEIEVVIDVDNPLVGERGAAKIFAPQKGALPDEVKVLEQGMQNIVRLMKEEDNNLDKVFLSGAGGGLGGCLHYFFKARYKRADEFILDDLGLKNISADVVITGEGSFDRQSMMNKASGIIIKEFAAKNVPVFICCGKADLSGINDIPGNVKFIELKKYFGSVKESMQRFEEGIKRACGEIAEIYNETKI